MVLNSMELKHHLKSCSLAVSRNAKQKLAKFFCEPLPMEVGIQSIGQNILVNLYICICKVEEKCKDLY